MKWKMLFRIGLTVVVVVAIILFYLNNVLHSNSKDKISELVKSENLAFEEALVRHGSSEDIKKQTLNKEETGTHALKQKLPSEEDRQNGAVKVDDGDKKKDMKEEKDNSINKVKVQENIAEEHSVVNRIKVVENGAEGKGEGLNVGVEEKVHHGEEDGVVRMKAADDGQTLGLQPLHHRVGKEVRVQVHVIHLAVVACGDRAEEVMVLLKSALVLTTSTPFVLHIFAERELHGFFTDQFTLWPTDFLDKVEYRLYDITFPASENANEWKKLFKPCATQRLFIPSLLLDVDSMIYVDTDVLFLSPLTKLWSFFARFNATQLVALAPEHEDASTGWYNRFARHPYVPPLGVNSGVMLMNLTRLRQSTWLPSMLKFYKEYRLKITWGDQDLINIYFHYHPDELFKYTCDWNYRPDHCMYMSVCKPAEQHGAFVLHGSRRVMHNDKQPAFKAVYTAFKNFRLGQDVEFVLLETVRKNLESTGLTQCGKYRHIFLKQLQEVVMETRGHDAQGMLD
ncbi:glucoside xylosyltransferase 1-like [Babylonia areolata]|uniref:glucoside xylosyltransferase 1-like n=1 Tax=Babylonia areolata TaxID=304850 RepID=UPI003FD0CD75